MLDGRKKHYSTMLPSAETSTSEMAIQFGFLGPIHHTSICILHPGQFHLDVAYIFEKVLFSIIIIINVHVYDN